MAGRRLLQSGIIGSYQIGTTTGLVPQVVNSLNSSTLPSTITAQLNSSGKPLAC